MQNFGRKNFDYSTCACQIRHTFPPSKFYAIRQQPCDKVVHHTHNLVKDTIKTHNEKLLIFEYDITYTKLKPCIAGKVVKLMIKMNVYILPSIHHI